MRNVQPHLDLRNLTICFCHGLGNTHQPLAVLLSDGYELALKKQALKPKLLKLIWLEEQYAQQQLGQVSQ